MKCNGRCCRRAGQDECARRWPFFSAAGGSGWKPLLREKSGVRGLCPLGVRQAGASPQLSQDMISLRKHIIIGAGSGEESGVN